MNVSHKYARYIEIHSHLLGFILLLTLTNFQALAASIITAVAHHTRRPTWIKWWNCQFDLNIAMLRKNSLHNFSHVICRLLRWIYMQTTNLHIFITLCSDGNYHCSRLLVSYGKIFKFEIQTYQFRPMKPFPNFSCCLGHKISFQCFFCVAQYSFTDESSFPISGFMFVRHFFWNEFGWIH